MTIAGTPLRCAVELRALGTFVHVLVDGPVPAEEVAAVVRDELAALDLACSRFRDDSELLALAGAGGTVTVSPVLAGALSAALDVARATGGLVDPTLGGALRAAGYDRTFTALPADGPAAVCRPPRGDCWREIVVAGCEVSVPPDVELDLGATAKAWAADRLADRLAGDHGVLVNLGGDVAVAGPAPEGGWPVAVTDRPGGAVVQTVSLVGGGLATSSTTARTWRRGGTVLHHILDPATGRPAVPAWASASVCATTCVEANGVSTAALVLGTRALAWLEERGLPTCLVGLDGRVVRLNGWPEDPA